MSDTLPLPSAVMVTGANGTIGRALARRLRQDGCEVFRFDYTKGTEQLAAEHPTFAVIHLAGPPSIPGTTPIGRAIDDTAGLASRLFTTMDGRASRYLFASTGLVYGERLSRPATEADPALPDTLYGVCKLATEAQFFLANPMNPGTDVLRLANVYGSESKANTVVGTVLEQLLVAPPVPVNVRLHHTEPVRDFVYMDDAIEAFVTVLRNPAPQGVRISNVGTGIGTRIGDVAALGGRAAGYVAGVEITSERTGPGGHLVLDSRYLQRWSGWKPRTDLLEGLRRCFQERREMTGSRRTTE